MRPWHIFGLVMVLGSGCDKSADRAAPASTASASAPAEDPAAAAERAALLAKQCVLNCELVKDDVPPPQCAEMKAAEAEWRTTMKRIPEALKSGSTVKLKEANAAAGAAEQKFKSLEPGCKQACAAKCNAPAPK